MGHGLRGPLRWRFLSSDGAPPKQARWQTSAGPHCGYTPTGALRWRTPMPHANATRQCHTPVTLFRLAFSVAVVAFGGALSASLMTAFAAFVGGIFARRFGTAGAASVAAAAALGRFLPFERVVTRHAFDALLMRPVGEGHRRFLAAGGEGDHGAAGFRLGACWGRWRGCCAGGHGGRWWRRRGGAWRRRPFGS